MMKSMSADRGSNHTPLNLNNLFDRYSKPQIATLGKNKAGAMSSNVPNIFLVFSVLLFVGAFSFSLYQTQTSTNTRASEQQEIPIGHRTVTKLPFDSFTSYPTSYNGEEIPQSIYTSGEEAYSYVTNKNETKKYIIDRVARYYVFTEILAEKGLYTKPDMSTMDFTRLEAEIPEMEDQIKNNLITTSEWGFIKARFALTPNEDLIKNNFPDMKAKAQEKVNEYKSKMEQNPSGIEDLISNSNADSDLMTLNNAEQNEYKRNYQADQQAFFSDDQFHEFLYSVEPGKVSEVYTLKNAKDMPYAYLVVYMNNLEKKEYSTIDEALNAKKNLFNF